MARRGPHGRAHRGMRIGLRRKSAQIAKTITRAKILEAEKHIANSKRLRFRRYPNSMKQAAAKVPDALSPHGEHAPPDNAYGVPSP